MECRYHKGHSPNKNFLFYRQGVAFPSSLTIIPRRKRISEIQGVAFALAFNGSLPFSNIRSIRVSSNLEQVKRALTKHRGHPTDIDTIMKELTATQQT